MNDAEAAIRACACKAIDLLKTDGWRQGSNYRSTGPRCAEAAIAGAVGSHSTVMYNRVLDVALQHYPCRVSLLWQWNDVEGRTVEQVIDVLQRVAGGEGAEVAL